MTAIKTRWVDGILNKYFGEDPEAPDFKVMPGDFEIVHDKASGNRTFYLCCPGCHSVSGLPLRPTTPQGRDSWEWDGDIQLPTLNPSIHHIGCWHGWLKRGELVLA